MSGVASQKHQAWLVVHSSGGRELFLSHEDSPDISRLEDIESLQKNLKTKQLTRGTSASK